MRNTGILSITGLLALSACADLGFTDLPLAELPSDVTGPVQISDIDKPNVISPEPSPDAFNMAGVRTERIRPAPSGKPVVDFASDALPIPAPQPQTTPLPSDPEMAGTDTDAPAVDEDTDVAEAADPVEAPAADADTDADTDTAAATDELPTDAQPGQCFATITIPAVTETTTTQVLVTPATTKTETIPATYKTVTEQVLVSEATTRTEVVPATYRTETRRVPVDPAEGGDNAATEGQQFETVTERVEVKPEETRTIEVPAVYETVTERVQVRDAYTEWRPGGRVYAIGAEALGGTVLANRVTSSGVMSLIEIPAEFETVTKRVLVTPATTREETIPAEFEEVTRQVPVEGTGDAAADAGDVEFREVEVRVVDTPATVRTVPVPAQYKTVTRRVVDTPAMVRTVPVPAVYRDETVENEIEPARTERVEVICEANAIPDFIRSLQRALEARGFYDGPIDGIVGPKTREAVKAYQKGSSEILTIESARKLGLAI